MIKIAITGSIAMGKSFVAQKLKSMGFSLYDADLEVAKLFISDVKVRQEIARFFPEACIDQYIDKKVLADLVFNNQQKLAILESITHVRIKKQMQEFIKKAYLTRAKLVVFEIPLLFEKSLEAQFDYVITASAPPYLQKKRATVQRKMSNDRFKAIVKKQMIDYKKRQKADFIVHTGLGKALVVRELHTFIKKVICAK